MSKIFEKYIFKKKILCVIKHAKTRFIQKLLFLDFLCNNFLENDENRLFLGEKLNFMLYFKVKKIKFVHQKPTNRPSVE